MVISLEFQTGLIIVDDWLKMVAPAQTAVLFKELRCTLHSILKELISKPQVCYVDWSYEKVTCYNRSRTKHLLFWGYGESLCQKSRSGCHQMLPPPKSFMHEFNLQKIFGTEYLRWAGTGRISLTFKENLSKAELPFYKKCVYLFKMSHKVCYTSWPHTNPFGSTYYTENHVLRNLQNAPIGRDNWE